MNTQQITNVVKITRTVTGRELALDKLPSRVVLRDALSHLEMLRGWGRNVDDSIALFEKLLS